MTLQQLLEETNQDLFNANYQTNNPLDLGQFITKLEDLGATNEINHKEWLP